MLKQLKLQLQYPTGEIIASTVTNSDGEYVFDDVPPGDYIIEFGFTDDFVNTSSGFSLIDADFKTSVFMLDDGGEVADINAGVYRLSTLGDLYGLMLMKIMCSITMNLV